MSDDPENTTPPEAPPEMPPEPPAPPAPPAPPTAAPPPPAAPATPPGGSSSSNRNLMVVLSYLWILAIVPLIVETEDQDVQWHAKHGLVLFGFEVLIGIVFGMITMIPVLGCVIGIAGFFLPFVFLILHILCIVKALNNERFTIPGVSEFTEKF